VSFQLQVLDRTKTAMPPDTKSPTRGDCGHLRIGLFGMTKERLEPFDKLGLPWIQLVPYVPPKAKFEALQS